MSQNWTFTQLLGLSPDHFTIRSGIGNAKREKWLTLGEANGRIWGAFDNGKRPSFHVSILMEQMHFSCTCLSRKFPCQHIIGLLLLSTQTQFDSSIPPQWVKNHEADARRQQLKAERLPKQLFKPADLLILQQGLGELERWLHDLMQDGLATLAEKKKPYFDTIANRMWDMQAVTLSSKLQAVATIDKSNPEWPKLCLQQLGPLALLIEGFKRFEQQSVPIQADLLAATGRPFPLYSNGSSPIEDQWLVLGHFAEIVGKAQILTIWLRGQSSTRVAQIEQLVTSKHPNGVSYVTGATLQGSLLFGESAFPVRAKFIDLPTISDVPTPSTGSTTIRNALYDYTSAKAKNPWLSRFPLTLKTAVPLHENGRWFLSDSENNVLPITETFNYGWHLMALASGQPLGLFGLWDGVAFDPLTAHIEQNWVDLHTFWGVK